MAAGTPRCSLFQLVAAFLITGGVCVAWYHWVALSLFNVPTAAFGLREQGGPCPTPLQQQPALRQTLANPQQPAAPQQRPTPLHQRPPGETLCHQLLPQTNLLGCEGVSPGNVKLKDVARVNRVLRAVIPEGCRVPCEPELANTTGSATGKFFTADLKYFWTLIPKCMSTTMIDLFKTANEKHTLPFAFRATEFPRPFRCALSRQAELEGAKMLSNVREPLSHFASGYSEAVASIKREINLTSEQIKECARQMAACSEGDCCLKTTCGRYARENGLTLAQNEKKCSELLKSCSDCTWMEGPLDRPLALPLLERVMRLLSSAFPDCPAVGSARNAEHKSGCCFGGHFQNQWQHWRSGAGHVPHHCHKDSVLELKRLKEELNWTETLRIHKPWFVWRMERLQEDVEAMKRLVGDHPLAGLYDKPVRANTRDEKLKSPERKEPTFTFSELRSRLISRPDLLRNWCRYSAVDYLCNGYEDDFYSLCESALGIDSGGS